MAEQFADLIEELERKAEEEFNLARRWAIRRACDLLRTIMEPTLGKKHDLHYLDKAISLLKCKRSYELESRQCPGCYLQENCYFLEKAARVV